MKSHPVPAHDLLPDPEMKCVVGVGIMTPQIRTGGFPASGSYLFQKAIAYPMAKAKGLVKTLGENDLFL
jgi:hypothetical protein